MVSTMCKSQRVVRNVTHKLFTLLPEIIVLKSENHCLPKKGKNIAAIDFN